MGEARVQVRFAQHVQGLPDDLAGSVPRPYSPNHVEQLTVVWTRVRRPRCDDGWHVLCEAPEGALDRTDAEVAEPRVQPPGKLAGAGLVDDQGALAVHDLSHLIPGHARAVIGLLVRQGDKLVEGLEPFVMVGDDRAEGVHRVLADGLDDRELDAEPGVAGEEWMRPGRAVVGNHEPAADDVCPLLPIAQHSEAAHEREAGTTIQVDHFPASKSALSACNQPSIWTCPRMYSLNAGGWTLGK